MLHLAFVSIIVTQHAGSLTFSGVAAAGLRGEALRGGALEGYAAFYACCATVSGLTEISSLRSTGLSANEKPLSSH